MSESVGIRGPLPAPGDDIGVFQFGDEVAGAMFNNVHRGVFGGVRDALATSAAGRPAVPLEELRRRFGYDIGGVTDWLGIDTLSGSGGPLTILFEAQPDGVPVASLAPMRESHAVAVLVALAAVVEAAERRGKPLVGIHPLTTYVTESEAGPRFAAVAPRALPFLLGMPPARGGLCLADAYAPAEVWKQDSVGTSADVFSLCALGLFLLTGAHPFPSDGDPNQAIGHVLRGDPPAVTHAGIGAILQRGLARDPASRISLADFHAQLTAAR